MKRQLSKSAIIIVGIILFIVMRSIVVEATETIAASPYPKVEYNYSTEVQSGTIRFISQIPESSLFNWDYWPSNTFGEYYGPRNECGTACISMALSYIGVNYLPKDILTPYNGVTYWDKWTNATYLRPDLYPAIENYINGNGKYSPVVIHLPSYSEKGHYVLIIGRISATQYIIANPAGDANGVMTLDGNRWSYEGKGGVIDEVIQWYNSNSVICTHDSNYTSTGCCGKCGAWLPNQNDSVSVTPGIYKTTQDTYLRVHPYAVSDSAHGEPATSVSKGIQVQVNGALINGIGHTWYRVTYNGKNGFMYAENLTYVSGLDPTITLSGDNAPTVLTQGAVFSIYGTITSNYALTHVDVGVYNSSSGGSRLIGKDVDCSGTSYNIHNLDSYVEFNKLNPGTYWYRITASSAGKTIILKNVSFTIQKSGEAADQAPRGYLDTAEGAAGKIRVTGWTYDPDDTTASLTVHAYVDGVHVATNVANQSYAYVDEVFPGAGKYHGYDFTFNYLVSTAGTHTVEVYGLNTNTAGVNTRLTGSPKTVTVNPDQAPKGVLESAGGEINKIQVTGWAYDPDDPDTPLTVHVYVDGIYKAASIANLFRSDVDDVYPGAGKYHGYNFSFDYIVSTTETHKVEVYALNTNTAGVNQILAGSPKSVTVEPTPKYQIQYDANGGTGAPAPQTKTYGIDLTLSSTKPTRANTSAGSYTVTFNANGGSSTGADGNKIAAQITSSYSFKNWNTGPAGIGTSYEAGAKYTANASATLYAQWITSTSTAAIVLPTPIWEGHTFKGWNTGSAGIGTTYEAGTKFTPSRDLTLYAIWETNKYTITYDANGGTGAPASQTKTHGTDLTLSSTQPTRTSTSARSFTVIFNANGGSYTGIAGNQMTASRTTTYSFKNWNTASNGSGTAYASGGNYTANASVTLYAQWNENISTSAITLPTPTWEDHTFLGWSAVSTDSSGIIGSYTPTSDNITLYAIWQADEPTPIAESRFEIGSNIASQGQEVILDVVLYENPGIAAINFKIDYDNSRLKLIGYEDVGLTGWTIGINAGEKAVWVDENGSDVNGTILRLKFLVLENAENGTAYVTLSQLSVSDSQEKMLNLGITPGSIVITDHISGDVTDDGVVDVFDLLRLKRYLAGMDVDVKLSNADVTADGETNIFDLLRLKRYLAGMDVILE